MTTPIMQLGITVFPDPRGIQQSAEFNEVQFFVPTHKTTHIFLVPTQKITTRQQTIMFFCTLPRYGFESGHRECNFQTPWLEYL